ncbi:triphosphoribosyl-dephospho-CoA synthase MdcB [Noviherbaspirillum saxi]|uniref:Probable 2-(5''-triphosphoribosyl)-3'-dephosphocoenzyme-A synthase n=2 Tax=Noviherbaspirillum saxi TaxID=2320863 RepID=A0A3A3FGU7_9BURK|nr:triphosphoribosyl-dephospho-CoA synthase MdcB [Noviherbaspirillum saxi]
MHVNAESRAPDTLSGYTSAVSSNRGICRQDRTFCHDIARLAVHCLYTELALYPKPGLVSLIDNGSHEDMSASTFLRSLFALRHYFVRITLAGISGASFETLKQLGIDAERRMLAATAGVNTHRGAIFCLGMLCAAAGHCKAEGNDLSAADIRQTLLSQWGSALAAHTHCTAPTSHGQRMSAVHTVGGAREEMAQGLPSLFDVALPALRRTLADGRSPHAARIDALFSLMAHMSDTNVYHRGGLTGAELVRSHARAFLKQGGTAHPEWRSTAVALHELFSQKKLSPGGAADLLAATCFVHHLYQDFI